MSELDDLKLGRMKPESLALIVAKLRRIADDVESGVETIDTVTGWSDSCRALFTIELVRRPTPKKRARK